MHAPMMNNIQEEGGAGMHAYIYIILSVTRVQVAQSNSSPSIVPASMKTIVLLLILIIGLDKKSTGSLTIRYNGTISIHESNGNGGYKLYFCSPELSKCEEDNDRACRRDAKWMSNLRMTDYNELISSLQNDDPECKSVTSAASQSPDNNVTQITLGSMVGTLVVLLAVVTTGWVWTCWMMKKQAKTKTNSLTNTRWAKKTTNND